MMRRGLGHGMTEPGVDIETFDGDEARMLSGIVSDMYRAVFSLPPFSGDDAEFANQRSYFPGLTTRAGFRLAIARAEDAYAGFGYGFLLPPIRIGGRGWLSPSAPSSPARTDIAPSPLSTTACCQAGVAAVLAGPSTTSCWAGPVPSGQRFRCSPRQPRRRRSIGSGDGGRSRTRRWTLPSRPPYSTFSCWRKCQ